LSIEALPAEVAELAPATRRPGMARMLVRNPSVVIGATIVAFLALMGLLAPMLGTISPSEINPVFRNKKPGAERTIRADDGKEMQFVHRFGTDSLGRDVYSRVVYGARVSLIIGITVAVLSVAVGPHHRTDRRLHPLARRLHHAHHGRPDGDPAILLAMGVVSLSRAGLVAVVIAIVIPTYPASCAWCGRSCCRSARSPTSRPPSPSAPPRRRCSCATCCRTRGPLIVQGTFICGSAILIEAVLSFLGIGIPPETPTWGNIMAEGRSLFRIFPTTSSIPACSWRSRSRHQHAGRRSARHARPRFRQAGVRRRWPKPLTRPRHRRLTVRLPRGSDRRMPSRTSPSRSAPARSSASSANRAPASP
jgi:peptide/nickel transport system permease protein